MKILIADAFDDSLPGRLAAFGEVTSDAAKAAEADVLLVRSKTKVTKEYLAGAPNLKLIIRGGVGLDNIDVEAARGKGIEVKNTPRASSIAVAELTFALMMVVPNRIIEGHNGIKEGKFLKKELKRTELYGKTLGLLGAGLIGTEVARRALAFGMRVVAHDHYISNHALAELIEDDDEFYSVCDFISVHLPLTAETKGMIDRNTIAKMKDGVILLNTARGKVVVEEDLAEALKSGKVRAYATDVFYSDPPDPSSPLLTAPNVVMTPHIGGSSKENLLRIGDNVIDILKKWKR
ncbi:MAG: hydroxyacid dehydrogenase [Holophagales bacterium]|nr:hydroxyacid dehydrogenase [Holophagales bacterium]